MFTCLAFIGLFLSLLGIGGFVADYAFSHSKWLDTLYNKLPMSWL